MGGGGVGGGRGSDSVFSSNVDGRLSLDEGSALGILVLLFAIFQ